MSERVEIILRLKSGKEFRFFASEYQIKRFKLDGTLSEFSFKDGVGEVPVYFEAQDVESISVATPIGDAQSRGDWIPVSVRLPEKNGHYIVSLEDAVDTSARFFNGKWFTSPVDFIAREYGEHEVFAWMPLPKPYKKKGV